MRTARRWLVWGMTLAGVAPIAHAQTRPVPAATWDEKRIALPLVRSGVAYVPRTPSTHVVIAISADAGWNAAMADLARSLAAKQAIVIGVSLPALKRAAAPEGGCWYVASDLE